MPKFILVTKEDGYRVMLRPEIIRSAEPYPYASGGMGSRIHLSEKVCFDDRITVKETPEQILALIEGANA